MVCKQLFAIFQIGICVYSIRTSFEHARQIIGLEHQDDRIYRNGALERGNRIDLGHIFSGILINDGNIRQIAGRRAGEGLGPCVVTDQLVLRQQRTAASIHVDPIRRGVSLARERHDHICGLDDNGKIDLDHAALRVNVV